MLCLKCRGSGRLKRTPKNRFGKVCKLCRGSGEVPGSPSKLISTFYPAQAGACETIARIQIPAGTKIICARELPENPGYWQPGGENLQFCDTYELVKDINGPWLRLIPSKAQLQETQDRR